MPPADRRSFLLGSAPLALFLFAPGAQAADPEEAALLVRVRSLWHTRSRRADELRARFGAAVGIGHGEHVLAVLADGLAWTGVAAAAARESPHDLAHPAFQAALREATEAIGRCVGVLAELVAGAAESPPADDVLVTDFDAVTSALEDPSEDEWSRAQLGEARARLRADLRHHGAAATLARVRRKLNQLVTAGEGIATRGSIVVQGANPAVTAASAQGRARWRDAAVDEETTALNAQQAVGMVLLGVVVAAGTLVFAAGVASWSCFCQAIPIMLLGLVVIVTGTCGMVGILNHGHHLEIARVVAPGWRGVSLPAGAWTRCRVWSTGLLNGQTWMLGPRGRLLVQPGEGAPLPAGPLGALVARLPSCGPEPFVLADRRLERAEITGMELNVNVPPDSVLSGVGYTVSWRAERP